MEQKKIVIVDIDGTISKVGDRIKYLEREPKDWDSFYKACGEDEPIDIIVDMVLELRDMYEIVFCTGRREGVREKTEDWLFKTNYYFDEVQILMRPDGDFRHDTEVKPEMLIRAGIRHQDVAFILEDRNSMVKKWRELGLTCLQVADGGF